METIDRVENFLSELLETNATLSFYCDFEKVKRNVDDIAISLNTLNYLLGKSDLRQAVENLWQKDPKIFEVLQILIANRREQHKKVIGGNNNIIEIQDYLLSVDGVVKYLEDTGLADLIRSREIKNFVDYVFGVEVGLDTHARKNRSGDLMENIVENIFQQNCISFEKQVKSSSYPTIQSALEGDNKIFDFVITTSECTYLIEVNFYHGGGSKPNETARAYTELAPKINSVEGYKFVWITDGIGWKSAKAMFTAAYNAITPNVYNLTNIQHFIDLIKN